MRAKRNSRGGERRLRRSLREYCARLRGADLESYAFLPFDPPAAVSQKRQSAQATKKTQSRQIRPGSLRRTLSGWELNRPFSRIGILGLMLACIRLFSCRFCRMSNLHYAFDPSFLIAGLGLLFLGLDLLESCGRCSLLIARRSLINWRRTTHEDIARH